MKSHSAKGLRSQAVVSQHFLYRFFSNLSVMTFLMAFIVLVCSLVVEAKKSNNQVTYEKFEFGVMGDTSYDEAGEIAYQDMVNYMNANEKFKFVAHVGDTMGGQPCTEAEFYRIRDEFNQVKFPLIYTMGDNEWADCLQKLPQVEPSDALALVRDIFYIQQSNPGDRGLSLGGKQIVLKRQSNEKSNHPNEGYTRSTYVENQRWVRGNVLFFTFHGVGSNDNCVAFHLDNTTEGSFDNPPTSCSQERRERELANIDWINESFAQAKRDGVMGVVAFSQAPLNYSDNVLPDGSCKAGLAGQAYQECKLREGYRQAIHAGINLINKPVAYLYGDGHLYDVKYPEPSLPNYVTSQAIGYQDVGYTRVVVDPSDPKLFVLSKGYCVGTGRLSFNCDPEIAKLVNPIATSDVTIPHSDSCGNPRGRSCESLVGNVMSDAMRDVTQAQFALQNSGGLRTNLTCPFEDDFGDLCPSDIYSDVPPPYIITDGQALLTVPFGNQVIRFDMTGEELKNWLENGVFAAGAGSFLQISGLCVTYDPSLPFGARMLSVVYQNTDGSCSDVPVALDAASSYSMATIDFLANGGDFYPMIDSSRWSEFGRQDQVLQDYLTNAGMIQPRIQGRIQCLSSGVVACPEPLP